VDLCDLLKRYLTENGYEVTSVGSGQEMDSYLSENQTDLIILDIMLPGEDGLSIAKRLKSITQAPIIMLSARGEEIDRILGLEMGADDYLAKPFSSRELLARIRAQLRRNQLIESSAEPKTKETSFSFSRFTLDLIQQQLRSDVDIYPLTTGEFLLLRVFLENPEVEMNRDQIMQKLKGHERDPFDRSIDIRVTRLRKKIEPDPSKPVFIRTIWGKGYIFTPNGRRSDEPTGDEVWESSNKNRRKTKK
ncbi:MAG: response regulator, partial [Gammaproteobacteria bacterium]|nr:response regulator [Gammaproteobacteria bacterium]